MTRGTSNLESLGKGIASDGFKRAKRPEIRILMDKWVAAGLALPSFETPA